MSPRKHAPTRLTTYIDVHNNNIEQLLHEGFLVSEDLSFEAAEGHLLMIGRLNCRGGIYIDVSKRLRILQEAEELTVQTVDYSYNVAIRGVGNIFRYDSPHASHNREHHIHRYDVLNADHDGQVEFDYRDNAWPTLREVVDEASAWYYDNVATLVERGFETFD